MDLTWEDLLPFAGSLTEEQANILIRGANARAASVAPCITAEDFPHKEAVRDIIWGAVLRRLETLSAGKVTKTIGPFSESREGSQVMFWPGEINELQALCASAATVAGSPVYSFPDALTWPC